MKFNTSEVDACLAAVRRPYACDREDIGVPDQLRDQPARWPVGELIRLAGCDHPTFVHDDHVVRVGSDLRPLVSDHKYRDATLCDQPKKLLAYRAAGQLIKRRERFVEQQQTRVAGQGASQGKPLLLTAGQLMGITLSFIPQSNHLQELADTLLRFRT